MPSLAIRAVSLLLGLVVVNAMHRGGGVIVYQGRVLVAMAGLGLPGTLFVAALGAIVSLRAATVRQAQQTLSGAILVLFVLPVAAVRWIPEAWTPGAISSATLDSGTVALAAIALAAVDTAFVLVARARFQRARIITS